MEAGRLEEAGKEVASRLLQSPSHPELLYWKAVVEFRGGSGDQAIQTLQSLMQEGLGSAPHYLLLGEIYNSTGRWKEASRILTEANRRWSSPRLAFNLALAEFRSGDFAAARDTLTPHVEREGIEIQITHLMGLACLAAGDQKKALLYLERAVIRQPDSATLHYDYALALMEAGNLPQAAGHLTQAVKRQPDWPQAHLMLGRALHDLNLAHDALSAFQEARRLDDTLPQLHHHFGVLYKGRGEYDKAIREFEAEISGGAAQAPTFHHLADLLSKRRQGERALALAEKAVAFSPSNPDYRLLAAKLALQTNDLDSARRHVEAALKSAPDSSQAYYLLGRILQVQGLTKEARAAFERSRALAEHQGREPIQ